MQNLELQLSVSAANTQNLLKQQRNSRRQDSFILGLPWRGLPSERASCQSIAVEQTEEKVDRMGWGGSRLTETICLGFSLMEGVRQHLEEE